MNTVVVAALVLEMFSAPVTLTIEPNVDSIHAHTILANSQVVMSTLVDSDEAWCVSQDTGYTVDVGKSSEVDFDNIDKPIQLLLAQPIIYDINAMEKECRVGYTLVTVTPK
ncbi:MAG: hypothetical protein ACRDDY_05400 [Clostridium sp.]|uniref:hypothetical protein n=1 Tax=Clostridium sp. TaxID=1506 RepID=UPI003EE673CF